MKAVPVRVSPTGVSSFVNCRRRWQLEQSFKPRTDNAAAVMGLTAHAGLAAKALGQDAGEAIRAALAKEPPILEPGELEAVMAQAMPLVEAWSPPPDWKVLDVERWFEVKVPGPKRTLRSVRLVGRMDLVIEDSQGLRWIVDHKTSRRQPNMDYVRDIDEQLLLYYAAARRMGEEIEGVIWNALIVPGIEQRKAETAQEYRIRCAEVLAADPLKHFVRVPVRYNNSQVGKAWDRVGYVVQEIRRGRIYRNPEACRYWGCPFMEVCLDERHALMLGFRPKADVSGGSEGGNE